MLLIYSKETGEIKGVNTSLVATFDNMYPNATEEFKQKYDGIVVEYNANYDKNRSWYKVENGKVIKLDSPFIEESKFRRHKIPDPRDQRIADLEMAIATILGGGM